MNVLHKISFICLLISLPATGRSQALKHHVIKLTGDDTGKKLAIAKGQKFILTLPDHVDGGYRFNKPQYNKVVLLFIKHDEVSPGNNNRPGSPGHDTWEFIAIKNGASTLKITASRPWAKSDIIIVYSGMVSVK